MKKATAPCHLATLGSFKEAGQRSLEVEWLDRLKGLPVAEAAASLYAGRGLRLASLAAQKVGARLFIVSAGLGLVPAEQAIPSYGLTIGGRGPDSVVTKVADTFDLSHWWEAVSHGPYSVSLTSVFGDEGRSLVLVALSQPYAQLLAAALNGLDDGRLERLRIVGANLERHLPARIARQVLPYDERLDSIHRGTRRDFPQRALLHFASHGLREYPSGDITTHAQWVHAVLSRHPTPARPTRLRLSDPEIVALIARTNETGLAMGEHLQRLRREGVACEQARFSRLFREAQKVLT